MFFPMLFEIELHRYGWNHYLNSEHYFRIPSLKTNGPILLCVYCCSLLNSKLWFKLQSVVHGNVIQLAQPTAVFSFLATGLNNTNQNSWRSKVKFNFELEISIQTKEGLEPLWSHEPRQREIFFKRLVALKTPKVSWKIAFQVPWQWWAHPTHPLDWHMKWSKASMYDDHYMDILYRSIYIYMIISLIHYIYIHNDYNIVIL